eukprot:7390753-Prymnesium_polylepis.3
MLPGSGASRSVHGWRCDSPTTGSHKVRELCATRDVNTSDGDWAEFWIRMVAEPPHWPNTHHD